MRVLDSKGCTTHGYERSVHFFVVRLRQVSIVLFGYHAVAFVELNTNLLLVQSSRGFSGTQASGYGIRLTQVTTACSEHGFHPS